jgi:hypothetical protein
MEARSTEPSDATSELVEGASAQSKSRVAVQPAPLRSQTAVARDLEVSRSLDLVGLWSAIVADYNNEILHERFVTACERGRALHFAAMKYQAVLDAAPTEPIALKMKTRVTGMVSQLFATSTVAAPSKFKFPSATKLLVFLGSFAIVAGLIAPQTGLAGVGISMLALAIGLRLTAS